MRNLDKKRFRFRARVLLFMFVLGMGAVAVRSGQLQIVQHENLSRLAQNQYLKKVKVPAKRGHIYDRNGKDMAISVDVPSIYADPSKIIDPRQIARVVSAKLDLDLDRVYQRLASDKVFVWLKRLVDPKIAREIKALKLDGIYLTKESKRFYPNKELASHLLGFTGVDNVGLEGIERFFDKSLAGEPQVIQTVRDATGHSVLGGGLDPEGLASGDNLRLTIDLQIQHKAEQVLSEQVLKSKSKSGVAVVMDVETSQILALAVAPSFNANKPAKVSMATRRNRAVVDMFEPGSTVKPFVVAYALEKQIIDIDDTFDCEEGEYEVGGHTIRDSHEYEDLDLTSIIQKSSNICTAKIAEKVGKRGLFENYRELGFASKTGIPFPGEASGIMRSWKDWTDVGLATISFGQGIAITAMQLAAAYRVFAADGYYQQPQLILSKEAPSGAVELVQPGRERRVYSSKVVSQIKPMLEKVVGPGGTGWRAAIDGYAVAGKTGTSQKIDPVTKGYSSHLYQAIFSGYVPSRDPKVIIVVMLDEPYKIHTGGAVAAPVFAEIAKTAMRQLSVLPSASLVDAGAAPIPTMDSAEEVEVTPNFPKRAPVEVSANIGKKVPSFLGLTARESIEQFVAMRLDVDLEMQGSGRVISQDPPKGTRRDSVEFLRLELKGK